MQMIQGYNIKLARDSRGIVQKKLAEMLSVNQATLSRYEKGLLEIPDDILPKLSDILHFPQSFFVSPLQNVGTESSFFYRKRATFSVKSLNKLEAYVCVISHAIDQMASSLELPNLDIPQVEPYEELQPEDIAYRIRNYFRLPKGPVVNIIGLLEQHGIIVVNLNIPDTEKFDGMTLFTKGGNCVVFINALFPNDRKRATLAHELGHCVMHLRSMNLEKPEDVKEQEANAFAGEFLVPRDQCIEEFTNMKFKDLPILKYEWLVSKAFIVYRATSIGAISQATERYFYISLGRQGERTNEKELVDIDSPKVLKQMIRLFLNDLQYSKEDLSNLMGINYQELENVTQEKGANIRSLLHVHYSK